MLSASNAVRIDVTHPHNSVAGLVRIRLVEQHLDVVIASRPSNNSAGKRPCVIGNARGPNQRVTRGRHFSRRSQRHVNHFVVAGSGGIFGHHFEGRRQTADRCQRNLVEHSAHHVEGKRRDLRGGAVPNGGAQLTIDLPFNAVAMSGALS